MTNADQKKQAVARAAIEYVEYDDIVGVGTGSTVDFFIEYLKSNLPNPLTHKIYFDYGTLGLDAEYEPYQMLVDSLMVRNGYEINKNWITKKFEGDSHHEDDWRKRFHYPIEFFLKK